MVNKPSSQIEEVRGAEVNYALSNLIPDALGREYAVFALFDTEQHTTISNDWYLGDVLSLQTNLRSAAQKTD